MATNTEQHYSLRWNDYTVKIVTAFQSLREEEDFLDVTVACDGHHYSAHKMVLSACSPYFRSLLRANPCQHPIVILKDVGHIEMERLLEFMYNGEVNIAQDQLAAFLKTAESLRIRGLAGSSEELDQNLSRGVSHNIYSCMNTGSIHGRNSPNVSFNQECKDDELNSDGVFHISSPAAKRRKRSSGTQIVTGVDNSTSHTNDSLTGDSLIDDSTGTDTGLEHLEDHHRMDRRELKSEPSDALGEVYADNSDLTQDQHHHDALPGTSGSIMGGHDEGLASNVTLGGAVCEALNLSVRSTPAILNGSCPASVSIHNMQRSLYHPPSSTVTLLPPSVPSDAHGHPTLITEAMMVPANSDAQIAYDDDEIESKVFTTNLGQQVVVSLPECSVAATTSDSKTKVYPCPECLKVFRHPMSLHHHRHVHKGTYTCQSCGKVFSRRWDLHRHIHRSKMGCRRPNHTAPDGVMRAPSFDLNNPPSN